MAHRKGEMMKRDTAEPAPALRRSGPLFSVSAAGFGALLSMCGLLWCLFGVPPTWAQGNTAVIAGADHVFIRRGPGTEFPPFANLSQGTTVEIQEMRGEWARVQTATGQSGYIRSTFLSLTGERPTAAISMATATRGVPSTATPAQRQIPTARPALEQTKSQPVEGRQPPEEVPASKGQMDVTSSASPAANVPGQEAEKLHGDVARLTAVVEQLQRRLDVDAPKESVPPLPPSSGEGGTLVLMSTAVLLTAIGLCVGWLFGSVYGRRQERGRRPRVRL